MADALDPRADPSDRPWCVLVVGMHRSGTSATASALASLGLKLPKPDDLLGVAYGNDRGHFESRSLVAFGDDLLARLGHSWNDPPEQTTECPDRLSRRLEAARACFAAAFDLDSPARSPRSGSRPDAVVWKDPRLSVLLPFWREALGRDWQIAVCHVVRHPLAVARSLHQRDGMPLTEALGIWERYVRSAVASSAGLPVLVSSFEDSLAEPSSFSGMASDFLRSLGIADAPAFTTEFDSTLVGADRYQSDPDIVLAPQQQLYDKVLSLSGIHADFLPPDLGPESLWTTETLQRRHDLVRVFKGFDWLGHKVVALSSSSTEPSGAAGARGLGGTAGARGLAGAGAAGDRDLAGAGTGAAGDVGGLGGPRRQQKPFPLDATQDTAAYHRWLAKRGEDPQVETPGRHFIPPRATTATGQGADASLGDAPAPLFSIVVPTYRTPPGALTKCVNSVLRQDFFDFELCLVDDGSGDRDLSKLLASAAGTDSRISVMELPQNLGISGATNVGVGGSRGEWVVFLDHDDELAPAALRQLAEAIAEHPEAGLLYSDEDKIDDNGLRFMPAFKPGWSPDLLLSNAYMCHLLVVRRAVLDEIGPLRREYDGAQDYDLMLRATECLEDHQIVHVPEILYHWRVTAGSASGDSGAKPWAFEAGRRVVEDAARRRQIPGTVIDHPYVKGSYHLVREVVGSPRVTAIIPFRDEPAMLMSCYRAFIEDPGHDEVELLLVDNDSVLPETQAVLARLSDDSRVRVLQAPGAFDWVKINNEAAAKATGELLLFLNNDVEARSRSWLAQLIAHAQRPEVGAVGARLLYPDGTVQHGGVAIGVCWGAAHTQAGLAGDCPGYLAHHAVTRNVSAVTGACLMTRRDVFDALGGFEPALPIAFNDIDYCLRLRERGLLVVYSPLAELVHHESKSRGHSDDAREVPVFHSRWREALLAGDPYYNPNLGRFDSYCRLPNEEDDETWERFRSMLNRSSPN